MFVVAPIVTEAVASSTPSVSPESASNVSSTGRDPAPAAHGVPGRSDQRAPEREVVVGFAPVTGVPVPYFHRVVPGLYSHPSGRCTRAAKFDGTGHVSEKSRW